MSCEKVMKLISSFVDGELDAARREGVAAHCESCEQCGAEVDLLRSISRGMSDLEKSDEQLSTSWDATLAARIAMVDQEILVDRNSGIRLMPPLVGVAASLLLGLFVGLVVGTTASRDESTDVASITEGGVARAGFEYPLFAAIELLEYRQAGVFAGGR